MVSIRNLYSILPAVLVTMFVLLYSAETVQAQDQELIVTEAFPGVNVNQILGLQPQPGSDNLFIVSQQGRIFRLDRSAQVQQLTTWLDLSSQLISGGERGLLGLAFDPDFEQNRRFYVNYTIANPLRTVISRFTTDENGDPDLASEQQLLIFNQPFSNHNGGDIAFGPDGFLYIASGDGGSGGDPQNNAQNPDNLLGAMLRIDVNTDDASYLIPEDNPFVNGGGMPEIFAWGLRNPWRISFDRESGVLWTGDVGQNAWEAIHIIENGKNYGWNILEGSNCFPPGSNCDPEGLELPVFEYNHNNGDRSITGGFVYRGQKNPSLYGKYIYGDFISGRVWALAFDEETFEAVSNTELINLPMNISSFAQDRDGELYILGYNNGGVFRIVTTPETSAVTQPLAEDSVPATFMMSWDEIPGADTYQYQIGNESSFENILAEGETALVSTEITVAETGQAAWARVRTQNEAGSGAWSEAVPFFIEDPVSVPVSAELPREVVLHPSYPNPFNPTTTLTFELPERAEIRLQVFDSTGRLVSTLATGTVQAGTHQVRFDGSGLASGLYFVRLQTGDMVMTRKMTLVK
ncbi:Por secretion system C-terminal sorting domain-containing protein [Cyclonatronum proteinivorum]|uniref:Por secretion system C-terminal sorting domain-containing protein n=2 Tax=Cyclonatronum proteinivorum TaxID=1457365 RepID=A0A345UJ35_9BACT|nr:Por secretion system C-terminal sorting domain-containing protein [Cyclonatronum proteinivorum]